MKIFGRKEKPILTPYQELKFSEWLQSNSDWIRYANQVYRNVNGQVNIPRQANFTEYIKKGYAYNNNIYTAINRRAKAAKSLQWYVNKVKSERNLRKYINLGKKTINKKELIEAKKETFEEIDHGELYDLIKKPNPYQSFSQIIETLFIFYDSTGNAFLYKTQNPTTKKTLSLHILPADKVEIIAGKFTDPVGGYRVHMLDNNILGKDKVIHWKTVNPLYDQNGSHLYGMSPLQALTRIINNDNAGVDYQFYSFKNEGVKGILTGTDNTDIELSEDQIKLLKRKWKANQGVMSAKDITFNRAPLQYLKIGETPVDMDVLNARKINKEDIANVFRIHPSLLSQDAATLNNFDTAVKTLITQSVLPDINDLRDQINNNIGEEYDYKYFIDYDLMAIPELSEDLKDVADTYSKMDWVTTNEKRNATNYDDYDDPAADLLYTSGNEMPLGYDFDTSFDRIIDNENMETDQPEQD